MKYNFKDLNYLSKLEVKETYHQFAFFLLIIYLIYISNIFHFMPGSPHNFFLLSYYISKPFVRSDNLP